MKGYFFVWIGLCLLGSPLFPQAMTLDEAIQAAVQGVEQNLAKDVAVGVINFSSSSERFSNYVIDELSARLATGKRLVVVERRNIDLIGQEMDFQLSGNVSDESAQRIGVMLGAQSIISGSLVDTGVNYRFRITAINVESAVVEASISVTVSGRDEQTYFLLTGQRFMPPQTLPIPQIAPEVPVPDNFVRIPGGSFTLGSPGTEALRNGDEVQRHVLLGSFYMGKHEVTQREYEDVMGSLPESPFQGPNLPVEYVTWYHAIEYCNRRSEMEGLTPAYIIDEFKSDPNNLSADDLTRWTVTWNRGADGYRLPTEAEWEYACRAGTLGPFFTGRTISTDMANYDGNYPYAGGRRGIYREKTVEAGSFRPNPWGLYDMHGNVREWCWDWYGPYSSGGQSYPAGPSAGAARVVRGGSWYSGGEAVRSAYRDSLSPSYRAVDLGFRVVRSYF